MRVIFHIITPLNHICDYATKEIWMSQATKVIIIFPAHLSDNRWLDSTSFPMFFSTQRRMQPFPEKILAVSRRLMNAFLAVSENFPAAAGGYRERAVSGPLLSYTPSRMWMRLLAYTFSIKLAQNSFHVSTPAVYVMFLHLIALLAIRIPCDTASSSENLNDD